eukprot:m.381213 g.381213  ORF g.381213 m.381213 type:complete len:672 (-) comp20966_c0_seq2:326-2341(-)
MGASDDEDDPVVLEMPVKLSQALAKQLYLLQYPLRPANRPYGGEHAKPTARIKPNQQKIELGFKIQTQNDFYDTARGNDIGASAVTPLSAADATAVGGAPQQQQPMYPRGIMDHYTLRSSRVPMSTHYVVGAVTEDGVLNINPLEGITQLRPSLAHNDESEKSIADAKRKEMGPSSTDTHDDAPAGNRPYSVTFKRRETERAVAARMRSHTHLQKQSDAEPWTPLQYHPANTHKALETREKLRSRAKGTVMALPEKQRAYEWEIPTKATTAQSNTAAVASGGPQGGLHLRALAGLPLGKQVVGIMRQAQAMSLHEIMAYVTGATDPTDVVEHLQQYCCLINGVWVITSESLYDIHTLDDDTDVHAKLIQCRDYILLHFAHGRSVARADLRTRFRLSLQVLTEMLEKIAVRSTSDSQRRLWVFCEPRDDAFLETYPRVVRAQAQFWKDQLRRAQHRYKDGVFGVDVTAPTSVSNGTWMPTEASDARAAGARHSKIDSDSNSDEALASLPPLELNGQPNPPQEQLDHMVKMGLSRHAVCSPAFFTRVLALKRKKNTALWTFDPALDDTAHLDAAVGRSGGRVLHCHVEGSAPGTSSRMYVRAVCSQRPDDVAVNAYRDVVLELFARSTKVKKSDITEACTSAGVKPLPQSGYLRVMHELAESKANHWVLQSGP